MPGRGLARTVMANFSDSLLIPDASYRSARMMETPEQARLARSEGDNAAEAGGRGVWA